jgi:poly-gamma-glutamate synthesis protein (capsule biosynthesis protein)
MTGRAIAWKFNNDVTLAFKNLGQNFFGGQTLGIVNLEGPVSATEFQANPSPDNLIFNFPPQTIDALKFIGVNAVSQANNHSFNQGQAGFQNTQEMLKNANITPIGSETKFGLERFGSGKTKLSVIAIDLLEDKSDLTDTIKQEKQAGDIVLIFPHWGSEYEAAHNQSQENAAHSWIDAGADIIIGSHPHVVQDAEIYNGKPIFYSLGNLIFDQTFSSATQEGLIIKGTITDNQLTLELLPTKIINYQVELKTGDEKQNVIDKFKAQLPNVTFSDDSLKIKL